MNSGNLNNAISTPSRKNLSVRPTTKNNGGGRQRRKKRRGQSGDTPERDQRPGEVARDQSVKEEEPERQRESDSSREITESKAARIAKITERGELFEKEQTEKVHQGNARESGEHERD